MTMDKLEPARVAELLATVPDWQHDAAQGAITRSFKFADFRQAFAFMTQIALMAERRDHHPEWSNVWNRVQISWSTHDAGGLTQRDFDLARACDEAFARFAKADAR
jgi:4a-hydroxytetrahydrobiopterin dehydratase